MLIEKNILVECAPATRLNNGGGRRQSAEDLTRLEQKKVFRRAARERRTVEIRYQSTGKPAEGVLKRLVDPWFLRFPRIHGWCHLRQAERVFRLDRVQRVRLTDQTYTLPTDAKTRV